MRIHLVTEMMPVKFLYIRRGNRVAKLNKDKESWEQTANNNKSKVF